MGFQSSVMPLVAKIDLIDSEAKKKFIEIATAVSRHSLKSEPGVTKYAVCVDQNDPDGNSVYMVEEYVDDAAFQAHLTVDSVKRLVEFLQAKPENIAAPPDLTRFELVLKEEKKAAAVSVSDPLIVLATVYYKQARDVADQLSVWAEIVDTAGKEPDTLTYAVLRSKSVDHAHRLTVLESYPSHQALVTHSRGSALRQLQGKTVGTDLVFLKMVAGYISKDEPVRSSL